jgi:hypothetical protein
MLKMSYVKPEFLCADVIVENPMVWLIEIDSLPVDAGSLARPADSGIPDQLHSLHPGLRPGRHRFPHAAVTPSATASAIWRPLRETGVSRQPKSSWSTAADLGDTGSSG